MATVRQKQTVNFTDNPKEGVIEQVASFDEGWIGISNNGDGFNCTVENWKNMILLVNSVLPEEHKIKIQK